MKKLLAILAIMVSMQLTGCGTIETGNVGVRTQLGKVQQGVEGDGLYFSAFSHVEEYTAKETSVALANLTPKAKDKLMLKELDVTVYYKATAAKIASFVSTRAGMSAQMKGESYTRPGYFLIENLARGAISDKVADFDSQELHKNRQGLETEIKKALADELNKSDPGMFEITRVVVSTLLTDPSVEDSIRKNIQMSNDIDTAMKNVRKMKEEADAMTKTAGALTPMLLQHEYNVAIGKCAESTKCTLIVDGSKGGAMLNVKSN